MSRWDLLHLLYSVDHQPTHPRDRADLDSVVARCMAALDALPPADPITA